MAWNSQVRAGFETQAAEEFIPFNRSASTPEISSVKARTGTYALRFQSTAQAAFTWPVAADRVQVGAAFNHVGLIGTTGGATLFDLRDSADNPIARVQWVNSSNNLVLQVEGVEQDSESATLSVFAGEDTWHEVGLQVNVSDDGNGFVSFYVNGDRRLQYTGAIATAAVASLRVAGGSGTSIWASSLHVDDLMLDTSTINEPDAAPPNIQLAFRPVTGDGTSSQWTPVGETNNWEAVADTGGPDYDSTYVVTDNDNDRDLYTFGGYTAPEGYIIEAVIPTYIVRKTAASSAMQIEPVVYDGTDTEVGDALNLPSTYGYLWQRFDERPNSGGAWGTSVDSDAAVGMDAVVP